ncbi:heparinase II/III family protein [Pontiella sulfatireligans]|uniref:Heparinase II N-terminal domain-containing protein n=1 Tax=Pontiella sulfatireligans TaxID=2750658 RepID=A0A6C2UGP8_9BACT|nr:hypothetical protein [Pontiella sulfatireligans]VGO19099.1 hypothetical protein SCARR_01155 [Pontiella sulfatireligans]
MRCVKLMPLLSLALLLCSCSAESENPPEPINPPSVTAGDQPEESKQSVKASQKQVDSPDVLSFVMSYDLLAKMSIPQLKEHYDALLSDIGGWEKVKEIQAIEVWPYGYQGKGGNCPNCQPKFTKNIYPLDLKEGKLVCTHCKEIIYPSKKFKANHTVRLTMHGEAMDFDVYQSEVGMNYCLESVMQQEQLERLYGTVPVGKQGHRDIGLVSTLFFLYERTQDEIYAERCIEILLSLSENKKGVHINKLTFPENDIPDIEKGTSIQRIAGMDMHGMPGVENVWMLAFHSVGKATSAWEKFGDPQRLKNKVRQALIDRHENYVAYMISGMNGGEDGYSNPGNVFGRNLRSMVLTGACCDYPKALLDCAHFIDAIVRQYATFNGVEAEGGSYQNQVVGSLRNTMRSLRIAMKYALEKGLIEKDSLLDQYIQDVMTSAGRVKVGSFTYPNGERVRLADTTIPKTLTENRVFETNEIHPDAAWGYFPMCSENRTYLGLSLSSRKFYHHHNDDLSIVLWGSGKELLPKIGYCKSWYRYYITSAQNGSSVHWRNGPVLDEASRTLRDEYEQFRVDYPAPIPPALTYTPEAAKTVPELIETRKVGLRSYSVRKPELDYKEWRRTAVYEYTPEGLVTSVDAASPGTVEQGVQFRNRMLMLIPVHGTSSYLADFHRIAGGDMHQIGVKAPLGEDATTTCSAKKAQQEIADATRGYWSGKMRGAYLKAFKNVEVLDGSKPWDIEWVTESTGVRLKVWGTGSENTVLLSGESLDPIRDPYRKLWVSPADAPPMEFTPHLYIRREGSDDSTGTLQTITPLIYEHDRADQKNGDPIKEVKTVYFEQGTERLEEHKKPFVVRVLFASGRIDYLYSSYDREIRTVDGLEFMGRGAWVSKAKRQSKPWAAVTLRNSSVKGPGLELASIPLQKQPILEAGYRQDAGVESGYFRLKGIVKNPEHYIGMWGRADFGADVSNVYKITAIELQQDMNETLVKIDGRPGLEKRAEGWSYIGYPFKTGSQQASFEFEDRAEFYSDEFLSAIE